MNGKIKNGSGRVEPRALCMLGKHCTTELYILNPKRIAMFVYVLVYVGAGVCAHSSVCVWNGYHSSRAVHLGFFEIASFIEI